MREIERKITKVFERRVCLEIRTWLIAFIPLQNITNIEEGTKYDEIGI